MIKSELIQRSPIRILEKAAHGGVGAGNIGVIAGKKGIGKTACLVHLGIDKLLQGCKVIHISFACTTAHILSWYENIFAEIAKKNKLDSLRSIHDDIIRNRIVMNFSPDICDFSHIKERMSGIIMQGGNSTATIIIDGYDFSRAAQNEIGQFKNLAEEIEAELWFSATISDNEKISKSRSLPSALIPFEDFFSIVVVLEPIKNHTRLRLLKDHNCAKINATHLILDPKILLIVKEA